MIDRTSDFSRSEIFQKLPHETDKEEGLIYFFRLNIPVIASAHLADPLKERHEMLKRLVSECHLDALKVMVGHDIQKTKPKTFAELEFISKDENTRQYIPLKKGDSDAYDFYTHFFYREKVHQVKLFLTHVINSELSNFNYTENPADLIDSLLEKVKRPLNEIIIDGKQEILSNKLKLRKPEFEKEVVRNVITSVLSKPPFTDYEKIYKTVFNYVNGQLKELDRTDKNDSHHKMDANEFIQLKSLIKRSVELNSNYIISSQFLAGIKNDYWEMKTEKYTRRYKSEYDKLANADQETKETQRSNLEYKYRHLVTYNYFLLYCYKLLLFRNPGRSIRLENLINSKELLPENSIKIGKEENDPRVLKQLWNSPYYLFIRILKAENIYLINELKELHKRQMRNRKGIKEDEEIYGEKPVIDKLYSHYFKHPKNDNIITNARRLIRNSASKDDPKALENIEKSVCHMLNVMNILLHAGESKTGKAGNNESSKSKLNAEVRAILDAVLNILQPGIEAGKLMYAFFIEYREPQGDSYNLYPVISTTSKDAEFENFAIKMSENGLIYNALYGLAETVDGINPQTLMFTGKFPDGSIHSFQDNFYKAPETSPQHSGSGLGSEYFNRTEVELKKNALSSEELFRNDFWNEETDMGLRMLSESNMTLIFRLSDFVPPHKKEKSHKLKGQAVLVITNTSETNYDNFISFMNIEKIRLLLLIKEELLEYLQKQFDNDAFMEVLENRKQAIYQRKLQHGLNRYIEAQSDFFTGLIKNPEEPEMKKKSKLFDIVKKAMVSQINFNTPVPSDMQSYKWQDLLETMGYIFECGDLGKYEIPVEAIKFIGFNSSDEARMHSSIPDVVIPELIINMKKYSSQLKEEQFLQVTYDKEKNQLVFENDIRESEQKSSDKKHFGGLEMCKWIMESLKYNNMISYASAQGKRYTTIVDLNLKKDANKNSHP
ncbi:MAG: hypothetical protein ACTHMC_08210 [Pseudobacter sp.]|uniref:hypothetical protein n=1 Tax=Pseudobacter sp. TaxID=2045420 RepID=UPI003F7EC2F1